MPRRWPNAASGVTPTAIMTRSAGSWTSPSTLIVSPEPLPSDAGHGHTGQDAYAVADEFVPHHATEGWVHGGKNLGQGFDHGHAELAAAEGVGQFAADVPGADDHDPPGGAEPAVHGERVGHGVQRMDAVEIDTGYRRADGLRAGGDEELVVSDGLDHSAVGDGGLAGADIGVDRRRLDGQLDAGGGQVLGVAVGEVTPIRCFAREVERAGRRSRSSGTGRRERR